MRTIRSLSVMQQTALALRREGKRIGFVPTMGYLHEGHLSLVRIARQQADTVVVSVFVNPAQFGPGEDLDTYPRDFDRDEKLCREEGVDIIFYPSAEEMYGSDATVCVVEEKLSSVLCGTSRPGHFQGVLTVCAKLFNIVMPDMAVFGQKDAQQLRLIQRMVRDLNFPLEIVPGPIVREPDGLAMSSRNACLSDSERKDALCLRRSLDLAEQMYADGERDAGRIKNAMTELISAVPAADIDYIEIVDWDNLEPVRMMHTTCLVALAVRIGRARLIDNALL